MSVAKSFFFFDPRITGHKRDTCLKKGVTRYYDQAVYRGYIIINHTMKLHGMDEEIYVLQYKSYEREQRWYFN